MNNLSKRILRTILCTAISFFMWFILSKTFATENDWDLSYEKETFIDIANLYNMPVDENGTKFGSKPSYWATGRLNDYFFSDSFINNFFSDVEYRLETTDYLQSDYGKISLSLNGGTIYVYASYDIPGYSGGSLQINKNRIEIKYTYSNNIFSFNNLNFINESGYNNIQGFNISSTTKLCTFYLSNNLNYTYNSSSAPYGDRSNFAEVVIQNKQVKIDPEKTYDNNILLNIDIINGNFINYEYGIYYLENEKKVYITDNVNYLSTSLWYGNMQGFYISPSYVSQLPNNTQFYIDVIFHIKKGGYESYILSNNTLPAFETGTITSGGTGEGEGGGGGSEGGGDTGGTSVDLSNIENTLGDINTSIIQTGQQTNQNLENINQNIEDLNNNITTVPDLSEKEEITGDDILENFDFEFTVDPYDNFWNTLLSELQSVLTTNNNRTITLEFRGEIYTISVDDFNLDKIPSILKNFLQLFSISVLTYFLLCWVKKSVDLISSGDMSEVLQMNEEEGIVDLF